MTSFWSTSSRTARGLTHIGQVLKASRCPRALKIILQRRTSLFYDPQQAVAGETVGLAPSLPRRDWNSSSTFRCFVIKSSRLAAR